MAKNETTKDAPAGQDAAADETKPDNVHYLERKVSEDTGVIDADTYHFPEYTVGGRDAITETDIHHLFVPGFDPSPYHFTWYTYSKVSECSKRFFTQCRKEHHGKWFRPQAWDPVHHAITCGWDPKANRKECILVVRSAKANFEEMRQMLAVSQDANDPEKGSQVEGAKDRLRSHASEKYVKVVGPGITTSEGRW